MHQADVSGPRTLPCGCSGPRPLLLFYHHLRAARNLFVGGGNVGSSSSPNHQLRTQATALVFLAKCHVVCHTPIMANAARMKVPHSIDDNRLRLSQANIILGQPRTPQCGNPPRGGGLPHRAQRAILDSRSPTLSIGYVDSKHRAYVYIRCAQIYLLLPFCFKPNFPFRSM